MDKLDIKLFNEKLKKNDYNLIFFTILIGIAVGFFVIALLGSKREVKYTYLNDLIVKENNNLENSYLEVHSAPYVFAEYDNDSSKFYIVQDADYLYIVYLDDEIYQEILDADLEKKPYRLEGYTENITDDVRNLAIDAYNELVSKDVVNIDNFDSYFGNIYLNTTDIYHSTDIFFMFAIAIGVFSLLSFIIVLKYRNDSIKTLNQFNEKELMTIAKELEAKSTIKYEKLYLTKTYIISLGSSIEIIKYKNIIWVYPQEYKFSLKNKQSLILITKDGNKHLINSLNLNNIDEIINKITKKSSKVLVGYTEENAALALSLYEVN